jgi:hypothetical protein
VRNQYYLLALVLSAAGHLALIAVLGRGGAAGDVLSHHAAGIVEMQLVASGDIAGHGRRIVPDLPTPDVSNSETAIAPAYSSKSDTEVATASQDIAGASDTTGSPPATPLPAVTNLGGDATAFPLLSPDLPHYFRAEELNETPVLLQDIDPDAFMALPDDIPPHTARAYILINEQGDVDQVIIDDEGISEQIKRVIGEAFAKIKFSPGKRDGVAVKSQLNIEISLERAKAVPVPIPVIMR